MIASAPQTRTAIAPRRFSARTWWSCSAAIALVIAQLAVSASLYHGWPDLILVFVIAPVISLLVFSHIIHRRSFTFDESANLLTIQGHLLFIPIGQPRILPIWNITNVEFIEGGEGGTTVTIELNGQRRFTVAEHNQFEPARDSFQAIDGIVNRSRQNRF